jgi:hypothetical protein
VDIGHNTHADEQRKKGKRNFRVRRNHPVKNEVMLEMSATKTRLGFTLTQPRHDRKMLEDEPTFQKLEAEYRAIFLSMHATVASRKIISVLAPHDSNDVLRFGTTNFIQSPEKIFSALVDINYNLRNELFHGSITPNEQHNEIYEPAYHIVMRFVRCTI